MCELAFLKGTSSLSQSNLLSQSDLLSQSKLVPLFITRFSLSSRSAIGVQTRLLVAPHSQWLHLHWVNYELKRQDSQSHRIESLPFSRWSFFSRHSSLFSRLYPMTGSWWINNKLRPEAARKLLAAYGGRVSVIYAAPLDNRDAGRMRQLVDLFERPFVLHLWDFLDGPIQAGSDIEWLVKHAKHVLCLSKPILEEVAPERPDAEYLLFSRKLSESRASAPQGRTLKVALIGDLASYKEGLAMLDDATSSLADRGLSIELCYIGPAATLKKLDLPIVRKIRYAGFMRSDAERDQALSFCHAAFLSGPFRSPESDSRSKYSIPSRVLDFFAVGLPIVGTVHPASATADLFRSVGLTESVFCGSSREVAEGLATLLDPAAWSTWSAASSAAYTQLHREAQPEKLKNFLSGAALQEAA